MADTGVMVPRSDPEALAGAVGALLAQGADGRARLGRRGRERIHAVFTMACVRQRFEGIYENVLAGRRL